MVAERHRRPWLVRDEIPFEGDPEVVERFVPPGECSGEESERERSRSHARRHRADRDSLGVRKEHVIEDRRASLIAEPSARHRQAVDPEEPQIVPREEMRISTRDDLDLAPRIVLASHFGVGGCEHCTRDPDPRESFGKRAEAVRCFRQAAPEVRQQFQVDRNLVQMLVGSTRSSERLAEALLRLIQLPAVHQEQHPDDADVLAVQPDPQVLGKARAGGEVGVGGLHVTQTEVHAKAHFMRQVAHLLVADLGGEPEHPADEGEAFLDAVGSPDSVAARVERHEQCLGIAEALCDLERHPAGLVPGLHSFGPETLNGEACKNPHAEQTFLVSEGLVRLLEERHNPFVEIVEGVNGMARAVAERRAGEPVCGSHSPRQIGRPEEGFASFRQMTGSPLCLSQ